MDIITRIKADIEQAMIDKDTQKKNALRALLAECQEFEKENNRPIAYEESNSLVTKQIKQVHESLDAFRKAGRHELGLEAQEQLTALKEYEPAQYTEEEVRGLAHAYIYEKNVNVTNKGELLKNLMPLFADQTDKDMIMRVIASFIQK